MKPTFVSTSTKTNGEQVPHVILLIDEGAPVFWSQYSGWVGLEFAYIYDSRQAAQETVESILVNGPPVRIIPLDMAQIGEVMDS